MKIRDLSINDLNERVRWMNDNRVNATLNIELPVTIPSTQAWFERIQSNPNRRDFSFVDDNELLVAMGGFTDIDMNLGEAELYIIVNPDIHSKGYGKKSVLLMCQYGFEIMNLKKIYLYTNSDNMSASKLYEKLGFTLEKYIPHGVMNHGELKDRLYYTLYSDEEITPPSNKYLICSDLKGVFLHDCNRNDKIYIV